MHSLSITKLERAKKDKACPQLPTLAGFSLKPKETVASAVFPYVFIIAYYAKKSRNDSGGSSRLLKQHYFTFMKRPLFARIEYKYVKSLFIPLPAIGRGILKSEEMSL